MGSFIRAQKAVNDCGGPCAGKIMMGSLFNAAPSRDLCLMCAAARSRNSEVSSPVAVCGLERLPHSCWAGQVPAVSVQLRDATDEGLTWRKENSKKSHSKRRVEQQKIRRKE
jgi:hypothetical protein